MERGGGSGLDARPHVVVRPVGLPIPIGYSALALGGGLVGSFHLSLLPVSQQHTVGLLVVLFVPALQLMTAVFSLLRDDTPAATETAVLGVAWLCTGASLIREHPGHTTATFGVFSILVAAALLSPLVATVKTRPIPAIVIAAALAHELGLGVYALAPSTAAERVAGGLGLALAAIALYASLAFSSR